MHVSVASIWELEIKRAARRLAIRVDLVEECEAAAFALLPIEVDDALAAARLPQHHSDPFDRMIVAQAQQHGLTLVTHDERLSRYQVAILEA